LEHSHLLVQLQQLLLVEEAAKVVRETAPQTTVLPQLHVFKVELNKKLSFLLPELIHPLFQLYFQMAILRRVKMGITSMHDGGLILQILQLTTTAVVEVLVVEVHEVAHVELLNLVVVDHLSGTAQWAAHLVKIQLLV
jgi:hypothetical protein